MAALLFWKVGLTLTNGDSRVFPDNPLSNRVTMGSYLSFCPLLNEECSGAEHASDVWGFGPRWAQILSVSLPISRLNYERRAAESLPAPGSSHRRGPRPPDSFKCV